jgi:rod shape determining protein RodA
LGIIKIQPSEFAKLFFIFTFAVHLSQVRDKMQRFTTVLTLGIHAAIIFGLVLLQKDLGSLTIFMFIFIAMCFAAGLSTWYFVLGGAICICVSPFAWARLNPYQQERIMMLFDPSIDPNGSGIRYHQLKSMTAVGNGGITGTGFAQGQITQSSMLPAKHTDMIFSCICEEFGLIGALIVLAITIYLVIRIIKCALRCTNQIGTFICVGVASMFIIQIIENVGMCLGIMPVIGITFPFLSYGGSSALSSFIAIGMVLTVSVHKEKTFFA